MSPQLALVTGATGQDGSLLVEELLARGWFVDAIVRPSFSDAESLPGAVRSHEVDLADGIALRDRIVDARPDFIFHLGAVSSVYESWQFPLSTSQINSISTVAVLDAASVLHDMGFESHVVNASSAEIFAGSSDSPQSEGTAVVPISPYGASKAFGLHMARIARHRGVKVSNAILYPHESTRRDPSFVTRKITRTVAAIAAGSDENLVLGNLDARRDWGWAEDYVKAMLLLADSKVSDDYVIATGESHSVRDFAATAFRVAGIESWEGRLVTDPSLARPTDGVDLVGDCSKLRREHGWRPTKRFVEIVTEMVSHDLALASGS
ncbi:GDP-mannose 4,6-dehydratase [Gordonia westfalica]|uniref:GDP-mannose 4,6-dehydratase n=1 Tax=Gordonia westfalica TaxID=158898 RepID=A0ABU2GYC1_9ACTN|nr:GDP-mannose 4,6-dehydratase [Gordonia westfalica]MDS1116005.1 GDP-mannose 4,6-dehydratase [Gordonia westfalica]